jgi:hypothetical protein
MASVTITFTDNDADEQIKCDFNFGPGGIQDASRAHHLAIDVMEMIKDIILEARAAGVTPNGSGH